MKSVLWLCCALSVVGFATTGAIAQRRPVDGARPGLMRDPLLRRLMEMRGKQRYSGTRVVELRVEGERRKQTEFILRDGLRQRTEFDQGSPAFGQIIVEDDIRREHYFPERNEIRVLPPRGDETYGRLSKMIRQVAIGSLQVRTQPGGSVAGVPTQSVSFSDREGAVIQKLWVEPDSGVVLKREIYDPVGTRVGSFEFTRINLRPTFAPDDFRILRPHAKRLTPDDVLQDMASRMGLRPLRIPDQFGLKLEDVRPLRIEGLRGIAQIYAGEPGRVSFFQIDTDIDSTRLNRLTGRQLDSVVWKVGGRSYALVGDVEHSLLERIAKSLGR